jgi:uncharacterized protein
VKCVATAWLVTLLVLLACASVTSAVEDMGLITGGEKGTYYQFGLDLQKLVKPAGINLSVHTSKGSVENIFAVYQRPGVHLGVVQSDVLAFVARLQTDPVLAMIAKKTRMVFPLYNEEVHLVVRKGITGFDGLAGRKVAVGREGSGTYLTARLLFKLSEVTPGEMVYIDTGEALAELKAGRVDAMFYVAGYPVKLFKEDITDRDQLALIPITNKSILEFYPQAEIPANVYPWQPTPIVTAAVKAVLISFDYRRKDCDNVGRVAQVVSQRLETLRATGHAKWKVVDLNYPLRGWEQYDCVRRALGKTAPAAAATATRATTGTPRPGQNPVMDAIQKALDR